MDDLTTQIIAFKQADLQTRVDYAVASKALHSQQGQGQAIVGLIQSAAKAQDQMVAAVKAMGPGNSGVAGLGECVDCQG